jgi:trigger factor
MIRIDLDAEEVDKAFEEKTREFQRQAVLPGFRRGKAPRDMVTTRFADEIQDEVKKKLIPDAYHQAVKDQKLRVIGYPDIEEIQFERGQPLQFVAKVETAPEFELPTYKGLPAKREIATVSEEDIEKAINLLRDRQVKYNTVSRPAQEGDYLVVNYTGTCEGKPLTELAPTARGLTGQQNFWIEVSKTSFIPGFAGQLIGASAGDKRTVEVDFPQDFVSEALVGKHGVYEVELVEVKEKILPELTDEFAKAYGADNVERLREGVRADLQNELNSKQSRSIRNQVTHALVSQVQCELPASLVLQETRNMVYNIVNENQQRGIPKDLIDQQKDQIYSAASQAASERVKAGFVLNKVAEKEGIRVEEIEVNERIIRLAAGYQMTPQQFVKELEKRNGLTDIYEQLQHEKVINLLVQYAHIEDVPAAAPQP